MLKWKPKYYKIKVNENKKDKKKYRTKMETKYTRQEIGVELNCKPKK